MGVPLRELREGGHRLHVARGRAAALDRDVIVLVEVDARAARVVLKERLVLHLPKPPRYLRNALLGVVGGVARLELPEPLGLAADFRVLMQPLLRLALAFEPVLALRLLLEHREARTLE